MTVPIGANPSRRARLAAAIALIAGVVALLATAAPALAVGQWRLSTRAAPTHLPLEGRGFIDVQATNFGDTAVNSLTAGESVVITDTLPEGMTVETEPTAKGAPEPIEAKRETGVVNETSAPGYVWNCTGKGTRTVKCVYDERNVPANEQHPIAPYEDLELQIRVHVHSGAGTFTNEATVEGGHDVAGGGTLATQSLATPLTVSAAAAPFGVEDGGYKVQPENEAGEPEPLAGSHPFALTTTLNFNQTIEALRKEGNPEFPAAPALVKNLHFNLPPGLLGNVTAEKQCGDVEFGTLNAQSINQCPEDTAIGVARLTLLEPISFTLVTVTVPVFNLAPREGEPARFGFVAKHVPVLLDTRVRTGGAGAPGEGDYGVEVYVSEATQLAQLLGSEVTLWGTPGDERHDESRGWGCIANGEEANHEVECGPSDQSKTAFLTMPTSCAESGMRTTVAGESWPFKAATEDGLGKTSTLASSFTLSPFQDCGALPFNPSLKLKPTTTEGSTPSGLEVDVKVPQKTTKESDKRAESAVRSTTVTLPEGVQLSPSAADGLQACSESEIGYQGSGSNNDPFSEGTPEPQRFNSEEPHCPDASKVGTVEVKTPLLNNPLKGAIYLAAQDANPFGSLVALYIAAEDKETGVRVKIAGEVKMNGATGQITSTFVNTPQVPFEDFVVNFNSGPRASISTPQSCGNYTTEASFTSWSGAVVGSSTEAGEFQVTSGPGGSPCANPLPFGPSFTAGSGSLQAGAFAPFSATITRPDSDQALKTVSVTLPPGAAAMLASVTQCPEPQASQGTCGPDSLIGKATAVSGYGSDPFTVNGGRVYITGPYGGGPFGLSIVTPAVAGPFNLGNVVVRSAIFVDRSTAQVTVKTTLPTFVSTAEHGDTGIPLQIHSVNLIVDRPNFEFNPTNCSPLTVTGTLGGANGGSASVSSHFQVANCGALPFHPTLTASTKGNASKANGASLTVKVTSSPGQANISKTRLVLPIALPSRLTTIQKACLAATFEANPATCPEGSNIGTAIAHTPVLRSPLSGPAYLVSHGNAAFPDVEFVLQGEGVTLILDGQTDIKKGITTSTFNSVPDAPVTTFETVLPEGPHSALTSNVPESKHFSLCGTKLVIPTTITGQNGVVINQNTKVPVSGCKPAKAESKLTKALKQCRKQFKHNKKKLKACEKKARKKYGKKKSSKKKSSKKKK
jgi:hypothetical protein